MRRPLELAAAFLLGLLVCWVLLLSDVRPLGDRVPTMPHTMDMPGMR